MSRFVVMIDCVARQNGGMAMFGLGKKASSVNNKQRIHKSAGSEASLIACVRSEDGDLSGR